MKRNGGTFDERAASRNTSSPLRSGSLISQTIASNLFSEISLTASRPLCHHLTVTPSRASLWTMLSPMIRSSSTRPITRSLCNIGQLRAQDRDRQSDGGATMYQVFHLNLSADVRNKSTDGPEPQASAIQRRGRGR